ncbi:recombinase family protein [Magnetospirillum fulvum]|uniref:Site-specific recombinase and resolvase superfamily protein n=1 Tax=Magnetospirillum fulvum MGU-K5 TaxID=1316936 RepID=S9TDN6_MAGFU|nr:recombinase family protein [Magnetospirillum fulvum]EPY00361.1 site-specific recombinase and resolvase superfamily protein [Magnetospirillum fulvum MGU-K5]
MNSTTPSRIAIYARYSTDIQNPSSVDDQVALCRNLIADQLKVDPDRALVFSDAAISGATTDRPGFLRLLTAAKAGRIDLVVAEGLDRLSRSLKDIAGIHETLVFHGVGILTAHEGRVSELHIGLKGTMNALFLRDLKAKVRRGLRARVTAGYAISPCPYGYKVVRGVVDEKGRNVNGVREIDEAEAAIVRRIFQECADGVPLKTIVAGLNRDGIPSANGGVWRVASLTNGFKRQGGILRNEAYLGKTIGNRCYVLRDPSTGKRKVISNPPEAWIRIDAPHLRIIDDETWRKVRKIDRARSKKETAPPQPRILTSHNQHALTGWVKCGCCGGPKSIANNGRYLCSNHRYYATCRNARGTREPVLLEKTFAALYFRIRTGADFRPRFVAAFGAELERRKELRRSEADIVARLDRLVEAIERGINAESATQRALALQEELNRLRLDTPTDPLPPLPNEATIRTILARAVQSVEMRRDVKRTRLMFQHLLSEIVLTPIVERYQGETIELTLREEGWPDFWRMVMAESAEAARDEE